ncbi:MAG TPA: NAD(P)-dependent oxidoreductase [Microlunatus sp.]|nr:NAD(P)-dependent oxidoreductase [Microlunatus sp.]
MIYSGLRARSPASSAVATPRLGLTVYGCGPDEAALFRRLAPRSGVIPRIVEAPLTEANAGLAAGTRCVSVSHRTPIDDAALRALRELGVHYLASRSIGLNHLDAAYARDLGITVRNVSYSPDSVADYTIMLILMVLRQAKSMIIRGAGHDYRLDEVRGRELRDLTVGVIGTGRIGAAVVDRLRGFGCRIVAHDPRPEIAVEHLPLDQLLRDSDVVTLHAPLTPATRHLLDRRRIAAIRPGGYLINTGRGGLIDTEALIEALRDGRLGGAGLDVVEGEESIFYADCRGRSLAGTAVHRLQELPNVVISPHRAYDTDHALRDLVEHTLTDCLEFESRNDHD